MITNQPPRETTDDMTKRRDELAEPDCEVHQFDKNCSMVTTWKRGWDARDAIANEQLAEMQAQNDSLKAQVEQLKIYLTNYQNDMIDKNKLLEIAVMALEFYEYPWTEYQYKNFLKDQGDRARQALAQIQKMRGSPSQIADKKEGE